MARHRRAHRNASAATSSQQQTWVQTRTTSPPQPPHDSSALRQSSCARRVRLKVRPPLLLAASSSPLLLQSAALATPPRPPLQPQSHSHPPPPLNAHGIPLAQLLWLLCCLSLAHNSMADCPSLCECKWKSGKESVLCLNANLTHIPAPLDAGTQVLDLTGNDIASVPHDAFAAANLLNLQKVYLARCRLRAIERFAFRKLINLVELDLSYNLLTSVPAQALECVPELRELRLSGNPIHRVPDEAFARVPQLVRLELSDCKLAVVEVRAFAGLESSLEWLKLDGNRLSEVRAGTITSLSNLHGIELARNQWNCSCALRPLRAWMLRENIPCGIPPLCRAPARLAGRPWDKIELDDFACVPQIIATDTTAHGVEGRNITMSCYVEGVPEPSVRWMVKNRVIANLTATGEPGAGPRIAAATQGRKTYVVNMLRNASNLTILTADMQDAGIYTCAAENKAGKVEASVTLAVSKRPPDAPLGFKIVLLCVFFALLFVVGSSFGAICFCTMRRKRKMRLWNSVPPARTDSYEKIEMTARVCSGGGIDGDGNAKPDLGGGSSAGGGSGGGGGSGSGGGGGGTGGGLFHNDEHCYLRTAATPLNCGSDDGGDTGVAIVNPSGGSAKRNGDYRNIPTHCDDDALGYEDNDHMQLGGSHFHKKSAGASATRWKGAALRNSPQDVKRQAASSTNGAAQLDETDLHIPRLIDLGSNTDSASSSISSQVDAAARLGGYSHMPTWTTTPIATTKINSPHSKLSHQSGSGGSGGGNSNNAFYGSDDVSTSVFCGSNDAEPDLFDSNYPDLLDIAKYAVAQATNSTAAQYCASGVGGGGMSNGALCTLPRKLKNTGKYFKNSSDSQSPLLADNSSKYGSSTLGDAAFLNDLTLGRRFSAESNYASYAGAATYTSGQRANSFLNLVQSSNKGGLGISGVSPVAAGGVGSAAGMCLPKRNPSLPSSPVHELQQHQRSFSSAATPLLDFSSLATRAGASAAAAAAVAGGTGASGLPPALLATPTTTSNVTAYDYHAAQLERFLEEYRNLQDQLCKMKETCETIRKKETPLRGHAAQLADPVMFNAAMSAGSPTTNPKTTMLKNKAILPGQPPDPPPYWLHRNAMLKRLNDSQTDIFKS